MPFSARKRREIVISGMLSLVFSVSSAILISQYTDALDVLTQPPLKSFAQSPQIKGVGTSIAPEPTNSPTPTVAIRISPSATPPSAAIIKKPDPSPTSTSAPVTPTAPPVATSQPTVSTSVQDILTALNNYRQSKGISSLSLDQKLQDFAQSRADTFASNGSMDSHAGFQSMLNDNGFEKMGFNGLGENSSFGEWGTPQNLIEVIYGNSSAHNESQLRSDWTHVGIGTKGAATDLIFGGKKR